MMTEYKIIIDEFCENPSGNHDAANWGDDHKYIGSTIDFFTSRYENSKVKNLVDEYSNISFTIAGSNLLGHYLNYMRKKEKLKIELSVENIGYDINDILSNYKKAYDKKVDDGKKDKIKIFFCCRELEQEQSKLNEIIELIRTKYPLAQDVFDFNTIYYDDYGKDQNKDQNSDNTLLFVPEDVWNNLTNIKKPQFTFYCANEEKISEKPGSHYWQGEGDNIKEVICSYFESLCLAQIVKKYHEQKKKEYEKRDDLIDWLKVNPNHTIFCFERDYLVKGVKGEENIITYYTKNSINKDNVLISNTRLSSDEIDKYFNKEFFAEQEKCDQGRCELTVAENNVCDKVRIDFVNIDNLFVIERTKKGSTKYVYKIINPTNIERRIWGNGNIKNFEFFNGENVKKDEEGRVKYGKNDKINLIIKGQCQEHHEDYLPEKIIVDFNKSKIGPFDLNVSENNEFYVSIPLTCPDKDGIYTITAEGMRSHKKIFMDLIIGSPVTPDNFNIVFDFEKNNNLKQDKVIDKQVYTFKNIRGDIIEAEKNDKNEGDKHIVSYNLNNMRIATNIPENTIIVEFPNNIKTLTARIEYTIHGNRCVCNENGKNNARDEYINLDPSRVGSIDLHTRRIKVGSVFYKIIFKKRRDPRIIPLIALVVLSIISCFTHCFVWFGMTLPLLFIYFAPLIVAEFTVFPKSKREELKEKSQYLIISIICIIISILIIIHAVYEECFK